MGLNGNWDANWISGNLEEVRGTEASGMGDANRVGWAYAKDGRSNANFYSAQGCNVFHTPSSHENTIGFNAKNKRDFMALHPGSPTQRGGAKSNSTLFNTIQSNFEGGNVSSE